MGVGSGEDHCITEFRVGYWPVSCSLVRHISIDVRGQN
jgi:hypothetical protein